MSELKTLKVGDWLRDKNAGGVRKVDLVYGGQVVMHGLNGTLRVWSLSTIDKYFDRLPDCDSFDWEPPQPEPTRTPIHWWIRDSDGIVFATVSDYVPDDAKEIKSDGEGGWYI